MSKKEKYTITNLLENDAFIAWIHSNKNDEFWSKEQKKLKNEEFIQFEKAVKTLNKLHTLPIDGIETKLSISSINQEFDRLLSSINKKKKVIKMPAVLKYAAAIILLISVSVALKFAFTPSNSFEQHLTKTAYNTSDILLQTPNKEYFKISDKTNSTWVTKNGVTVTISKNGISFSKNKDIVQGDLYTLIIPKNKKYTLTLIDETSVELNENTTIRFSTSTTSKERNVSLVGEAFFDVTHHKKRPFIVQSSDLKIKVLGTSFNVSNYEKNGYTSTTLIEGSITVANPQGETKTITPGNQAKITHNQNHINVSKVDLQISTSWTQNRMIFTNETLENIISRLKVWHPKTTITYKNKEIKLLKFTGTLKKENSVTHFLEMLKYTQNINYTIDNKNNITLFNN